MLCLCVHRCQCLVNFWSFGLSFKSWAAESKRSNSFLCCRRNESNTEPECGGRGGKKRRRRRKKRARGGELRWGMTAKNKIIKILVSCTNSFQSDLLCTGRAGKAKVQWSYWWGGWEGWGRWGSEQKGEETVKGREEQNITNSNTTSKNQSALPKGTTSWSYSWRCLCVCILWSVPDQIKWFPLIII